MFLGDTIAKSEAKLKEIIVKGNKFMEIATANVESSALVANSILQVFHLFACDCLYSSLLLSFLYFNLELGNIKRN